jgi:hypothetical protein
MARGKPAGHGNGKTPKPEWIGYELVSPYADMVRVDMGERALLITFGQIQPAVVKVQTAAKVTLAPKTAAELLVLLAQQVMKYEKQHGKIMPAGFEVTLDEPGGES